jgi:hypothetical protein
MSLWEAIGLLCNLLTATCGSQQLPDKVVWHQLWFTWAVQRCPDYSGLPWLGKTRIFGSARQTLKSAVVSIFLSAPVSLNRQHSSDQTWAQTCRILLKDIERHTCWIKHPLLVILHLDDFKMPIVCWVLILKSYDCHEQSKCLPIHGESFLELAKIIRFNTFYSWIPRGWWGYIYIYVCVYIFEGIRTEICISWMS